MKRVQGLVAVSGLFLALSSALAAPPVVERIPDNALLTFIIPAPQELQKHLSALATAVESPAPVPAIEDLLAMGGVTRGLDLTKSFAVVVLGPKELDKPAAEPKADGDKPKADGDKSKDGAKPKRARRKAADDGEINWEEGMQRAVMIIPITKYEEFLANFDTKPAGEGKVDAFVGPGGDDAFAKDLGGGYAVIGPEKELVEGFTGKAGAGAGSFKSRLGKAGEAVADASDALFIINMDRIRPEAEKGLKQMEKQLKEQMAAMGQEAQEKNVAVMKWMADNVVHDTQIIVGGVKVGSLGVTADIVGSFKPDSYLAKAFAAKGDTSSMLTRLPGGPYLLAMALDCSSPGIKQVFKDLITRAELPGGPEAAKASAANVDNMDGQAAVVGFPMGGAFAGLFTSTVLFEASKSPDAALKGFKDSLAAMNGQKIENMTYTTKYTPNASKAGETALDAWESKLTAEGDDQPAQMQQGLAFLFGPQGMPVGYVAKADGGIYISYAKNSDLMAKALGASKGENLGSDAMIRQSAEMLPKGRMAEMFIGMKGILDLGLPFAAMGGFNIPADKIPEKLPPIAGSLTSQDGSLRMTLVIPTPVIKTGVSLGEAIQAAQEEGGGGEGGGKPKPEKGAGQPKF